MGKSIVMNKTREELLDFGFEDYGRYSYLLKVSSVNNSDNLINFVETKYNENILFLASYSDPRQGGKINDAFINNILKKRI